MSDTKLRFTPDTLVDGPNACDIYTAGIDDNACVRERETRSRMWGARIQCHGDTPNHATELRDLALAALHAQAAGSKVRRVYYAHAMLIYDTPQEQRDLDFLRKLDFEVLNPNTPEHSAGCKAMPKGMSMEYFRPLVNECDALAFRSLPDGQITAGVALEIEWAKQLGLPVFELPSGISRRAMTIPQTVEYLEEAGQR